MQAGHWRSPVASIAGRHAQLSEAVLVRLLLTASAVTLHRPLVDQEFWVDEGSWIATSRYFWTAFIDRDLFGRAWQPSYEVLTHPPVVRFVIGFGLWLQGWTPEWLNGLYQSRRDRAFNEAAGNVPSQELRTAARWVEFAFALGTMLLLSSVARTLCDRLTGILAVVLALSNPLLRTLWTRTSASSPSKCCFSSVASASCS